MITPSFHFEILNDFFHVMTEQSEIMIKNLEELSKSGQEINIFKQIALCALDIICGECFIFYFLQADLINFV